MKVIAFNASPNKEAGTTALILNPLLKGLAKNGADIEVNYIYDLNIEPCRGCTSELEFEPESCCRINDDMQELYPKLNDADVWIFASPNYLNNITSGLKNFLDRLEPLFVAPNVFEVNDAFEAIKAELVPRTTQGKILLISTCGHWGKENFSPIVEQMNAVSQMLGREFLPPILRPHSSVMTTLTSLGKPVQDIYEAAEEAGSELAKTGTLSDETIIKISREIVPQDSFIHELSVLIK